MKHQFVLRSHPRSPAGLPRGPARQRRHYFCPYAHSDYGPRRCGGRLQSSQLGQGCDAGGRRCDGAHGIEGGDDAHVIADIRQGQRLFRALYTRTDTTGITITSAYTTSGGSQLVVTGTANVPTTFMKIMGFSSLSDRCVVDGEVGQHEAARRARARQHRIDGKLRQNDGAPDRHKKSLGPTPKRRGSKWRRVCLDRSVCKGRQRRSGQLQPDLDRME